MSEVKTSKRDEQERTIKALDTLDVIQALERQGYSVSVDGTHSLTLHTDDSKRDWQGKSGTFHVFVDSVKLKVNQESGDDILGMVQRTSIRLTIRRALKLDKQPKSTPLVDQTIEAAVTPLKNDAIERAKTEAGKRIDCVLTKLAANNWDANIVAPRPDTYDIDRHTKLAYNQFVTMITNSGGGHSRAYGGPDIRLKSIAAEEKYIQDCANSAAIQYDTFVAKLVAKIGAYDTATLDGNHVWSYSILTVQKGAITEHWKTQQIINVSKNGLLFNQWPTRKVK